MSNIDEMAGINNSTCRAVMQILQQIGRHMDALERQILAVKTQLTETVNIMPKKNDKNIN